VNFGGFSDPKQTLFDALESLAKTYKLSFDVDERPFKIPGVMDVLKQPVARTPIPAMRNVPLAAVVRAVLAQLSPGATYYCDGDDIRITTRRGAVVDGLDSVQHLLEKHAYRIRYTGRTDFHLYGSKAVILLGKLGYWSNVISENAKALDAEAIASPNGGALRAPPPGGLPPR